MDNRWTKDNLPPIDPAILGRLAYETYFVQRPQLKLPVWLVRWDDLAPGEREAWMQVGTILQRYILGVAALAPTPEQQAAIHASHQQLAHAMTEPLVPPPPPIRKP
jgi:hypothetical protein